ncbi:acyltransferase [Polynucleobacter sphagniphilus]|uniref:acyltransferase n=1 Tax=Polynucleobacter sphagniphilus TaxID=1743169 RepID=UPI002473644D|nr:acyltransferase [Polynucleobacter sphagniphilus]MDH6525580.1 acetyltransferase-like isoleucine patch superfamily enzyme [Polynucleobacter sphagniphilus]
MINHIQIINSLYGRFFKLFYGSSFKYLGNRSYIVFPVAIEGSENIHVGDNSYIAAGTCLAAVPLTNLECNLHIGSGCSIGRYNHIYATHSVTIGCNVLTANGVYISDNLHDYRNPEIPILRQPIIQNGDVVIGEGSWIGHNACILGVKIGKQCIIGANSVVTKDIPDYSVVIGAPAIIIKRFNTFDGVWMLTNPDGTFQ